jgi:uncharacterized protein (DUF427 family)
MKTDLTSNVERPAFATEPGPAQESVWDYPRPPAVKRDSRSVEIRDGASVLAWATSSYKVMETASPPTFYVPRANVKLGLLVRMQQQTYCEWKGLASYWALARRPDVPVAWSYERPRPRFDVIKGLIAFYPDRVHCYLGGERVQAQAGPFYGGWITPEVVGPFKGEPGTGHW